jgi:hypothetical protein
MDIQDIIKQKKIEIENDEIKAAKAKEEKDKIDKIKKEKIKTYQIKTNHTDVKIKDFLSNFDFVNDIEEIYPERLYLFKVDTENNYRLLNKVFRDFEKESLKNIYLKSNSKEKSFEFVNTHIDESRNTKEEHIKNIEDNIKYTEEKKSSQYKYKNISTEILETKFSDFISNIYNIEKDKADKFTKSISEQVAQFMKKYPTFGGEVFYSFQFNPMVINSDQKHSETLNKTEVIDDILEDVVNKNRIHLKAFEDNLGNILKEAKNASGIGKLKINGYDDFESSDEVNLLLSKELKKNILDVDIPNCEHITGYPTFRFFNYYNMTERSNSSELPLVREMVNVFTAPHIANRKEKLFVHMDNIISRLQNNNIPIKIEDIIMDEKGNKQRRNRMNY